MNKNIFLHVMMCILSFGVQARFAFESEAPYEVLFYNRSIDVKKSGASTELIECKVKILNDSGLSNLVTTPFTYDSNNQVLKVLSAYTISKDGKKHAVAQKFIEDKSLAGSTQGFSSQHQVLVSYPHLQTGSELYLKYRLTQKYADLPNTFVNNFWYGSGGIWRSSKVTITSEIPLNYEVIDNSHVLKIEKKTAAQKTVLEISLEKAVFVSVLEEVDPSLNPNLLPHVYVSSIKNWGDIVEVVAPKYQKEYSQSLPPLFLAIAEHAKKEQGVVNQINAVTSALSSELVYMGDWRTKQEVLFPRSLKEIAEARRADCKDYATSLTAILRFMGMDAYPALVTRGGNYFNSDTLPSPYYFDHAIVQLKEKNGVRWLDPTNAISFAHGLFYDISDRNALVLSEKTKSLEHIPAVKPAEAVLELVEEVRFVNKDITEVKGTFSESGAGALGITGAQLYTSFENIAYYIVGFIADVNRIISYTVEPVDLTSRVVRDVTFKFGYTTKDASIKTNAGLAYQLRGSSISDRYLIKTDKRVSDLTVPGPQTLKRSSLLKNVKLSGSNKLNCRIDNEWALLQRTVLQRGADTEVRDELVVKKALISNRELQSPAYAEFQKQFEDCFANVALVFQLPAS